MAFITASGPRQKPGQPNNMVGHLLDEHPEIVIALIAGMPGILVFVYQVFQLLNARKKNKAETDKARAEADSIYAQVSERYAAQVGAMQEQIRKLLESERERGTRIGVLESQVLRLQAENQALRDRQSELATGIDVLTRQIVALGQKPAWKRNTGQLPDLHREG